KTSPIATPASLLSRSARSNCARSDNTILARGPEQFAGDKRNTRPDSPFDRRRFAITIRRLSTRRWEGGGWRLEAGGWWRGGGGRRWEVGGWRLDEAAPLDACHAARNGIVHQLSRPRKPRGRAAGHQQGSRARSDCPGSGAFCLLLDLHGDADSDGAYPRT